MSDYCALCGKPLSSFFSKSLICANEEEFFCSACYKTLSEMDSIQRGTHLLEHGQPQQPEKMREFMEHSRAAAQRKKELEPPTRPCPNCGGTMEVKLKGFRIGADGNGGVYLFGGYEQYYVDLYACSGCGKVEMYTADFAILKKREEATQQEITCPTCGCTHSSLVGCPRCALNQAEIGQVSRPFKSSSQEKPPWEK